ncbi:MAG: AAA family ATPase [Bacilli bacterium]|nr:AAA family ATPase [Bacilli bacterium]
MSDFEERIAIIFDKKDRLWEASLITIVDYYKPNRSFDIKIGDLKHEDFDEFNLVTGDPHFIENDDTILELSYEEEDNNRAIYIFENTYADEIINRHKFNDEDAFFYIAKRALNISLIENGDFLISKNTHKKDWKSEEIIDLLSGTLASEEVTSNTNNGIGIMIPIQIMPDEIRKNSLEKLYKSHKQKEERVISENIDVNRIIDEISSKIVGQEEAIRTLVANIYYNQLLIESLEQKEIDNPLLLDSSKITILLDGSTGTGKTAIMKDIATKFGLPIVITNSNSFSETGYVGPTITDLLEKLIHQANGDIELAQKGIIVLDEIDKLAVNTNIVGRDMKQGVQEELLGFISGGEYEVVLGNGPFAERIDFDTSKLTFILSGAFTDLRDNLIKKQETKSIGFSNGLDNTKDKTYVITPEDYIDYGLKREFFGRIKVLASTKTYMVEDLKEILLSSLISPLKNLEETVKLFGYKGITFNEEFIDKIAMEAYKMNTGARALQTIISGIQNNLLMALINKDFTEDYIDLSINLYKEYEKSRVRKY